MGFSIGFNSLGLVSFIVTLISLLAIAIIYSRIKQINSIMFWLVSSIAILIVSYLISIVLF